MVKSKLTPIPECIEYAKNLLADGTLDMRVVKEAPFLVRLISRDEYCAYKGIVYTPIRHLEFSSSRNEEDRYVAAAKLMTWIMYVRDGRSNSLITLWKMFNMYELRLFYFLYEYGVLSISKCVYTDTILGGFAVTRRKWFRQVTADQVIQDLKTHLN